MLLVLLVLGAGYWRYRITRPAYRLAQGTEAVKARDWDTVERYATQLEAGTHSDHANLLRGEMLLARSRYAESLASFNRIRDEGQLRLRAAVGSGKCLLELRQMREAFRVFSFVLEQEPNHIDGHRGLAAAAYDLGQLSLAGNHLHKVAELDTTDARPHRLIGLIHKDLSHLPEAVEAYREALRRNSLPPAVQGEVRIELANVLLQQGQFADAFTELNRAITDGGPGLATPDWFAAGAECHRGLGQVADAKTVVERGLQQGPSARLHRVRGQLELDAGRHADAIEPLQKAIQLAPTDYEARYLLSQALAGVGRKEDAARELKRGEELRADFTKLTDLTSEAMAKPWDATVRRQLADLCEKLQKPQLAVMWRTAAIAVSATGP
jgi:tetratricopeptide (TPR) repeat protein